MKDVSRAIVALTLLINTDVKENAKRSHTEINTPISRPVHSFVGHTYVG